MKGKLSHSEIVVSIYDNFDCVRSGEKRREVIKIIIKDVSVDYKLCKDCEYNESADEEYSTKLICGRHGKIVDVRDEACKDFVERGSND